MTSPAPATGTAPLRWRDGLLPVAVGWVVARVCIALGNLVARGLLDVLDTPRGDHHLAEGLVTWDATYYRLLAEQWYTPLQEDAARFFPLYPGLARLVSPVLGGREDWALVVITNLAALGGALVLWRLVAEVLDDRRVAERAAWMIAVFPGAFVLAWAYSEGLALLFVAATLLALHRRAFALAGALGLLCAVLRPVGGLVLVPILVELYRARPRPPWWSALAAAGGPIAGLGIAMLWIERSTGDLWLPVRIQGDIRGGFQDPVTRVLDPVGEVLRGNFRDVYNLGVMVLLVLLAVVAVRRRQPWSWLAYGGVSLLVLLSSQVTDSIGRYALVVVPFVVALAQWAERRWQQVAVAALGCTGLVWMSSEAWLGRLVP